MTNTRFGVKAYQLSAAEMAALLESENYGASYGRIFDAQYFQGPIANPNWSSDKDPWRVRGKDNAKVTFTRDHFMGNWFREPVWNSRALSAADLGARCSYFGSGSNSESSSSYQTLCNSLGAQSSLVEAIENMRWQSINWSKLTPSSGEGPFVPEDNSSKSLRDKWQVVNYAREALWKRELSSSQKTARCALFSTSVTTDTGNVNLKSLCESAITASTAPDTFWGAMETNCWGEWNHTAQQWATEPVLGQDKCINSDNNTALNNLTGNNAASIDIDWDGTADSVKRWEKWKLIHKGTEAVWNRNLDKTNRQNRCSNFSTDNSTSGSGDSDFSSVPTSMKDLCLAAVNSDGAIVSFDDAMTAITDGPFVNWTSTIDNGSNAIQVTGTQPGEKTYKLYYDNGTAVQWPSNSHWAGDPRATDNTTFP
ncbi:MAG: hypothetical protein QF535_17030, partial [Anaerolineales bacterium]|nr:hypothetical protein [Anaerolineales bacterium]